MMRIGWLICISIFLMGLTSSSAQDISTYQIQFTDKGTYTLKDIKLSPKSLRRRQAQNIKLTQRDIPVFKPYIQSVNNLNVSIQFTSRWSNSIFAHLTPEQLAQLHTLDFVKKVTPTKSVLSDILETKSPQKQISFALPSSDYGFSDPQITQIEGKVLHENGYRGKDITIAVFDAGFYKVNEHPVFEKAFLENRIEAGPDFVRGNNEIVNYTFSAHGEMVLSTMAGEINGTYIGTSPDANYILIRTEDAASEKLIEEYYWLQAAEYVDSIGVDMINSSLGYTVFDDSSENHTYQQMDGDYTLITQAADWAAQAGILVVNSAGNSGASSWYYIGAPADGDSVFSIGAVNMDGISAAFSSHGPTFDGRVKPNVVGHGEGVYVASGQDQYGPSNGTSFSGPVICGMTACLWQYLKTEEPNISNMDVIERIEESAHLFPNYNEDYGYGIPNYNAIVPDITPYEMPLDEIGVYPNPFHSTLSIHYSFQPNDLIEIYSSTGQIIDVKSISTSCISFLVNTDHLPNGMYIIAIKSKKKNHILKAIK